MIKILINTSMALMFLLVSFSAYSSTIIEVKGIMYDVGVVDGSAINLMDQLNVQVWWNDSSMARDFANALHDEYEFPNFGNTAGPIFAYNYNSQSNDFSAFICDAFSPEHDCAFEYLNLPADSLNIFTVATQVPIPAAAWLFMSGLIGLLWKGRKAR